MKIYNKILCLLILTVLCCFSCEKWLTVDTKDRIMEDKLFSTPDGFLVALNGIYTGLINSSLYNGNLTFNNIDIMAQYYDCSDKKHSRNNVASLEPGTTKHIFDGTWSAAYSLINNLNTIIEHCESDRKILNDTDYNLYKGEALALRAFLHFDLLRIYGPIFSLGDQEGVMPYQDYSAITPSPMLSASKVSERIMDDLYAAEELLAISDPIITKGPSAIAVENESNNLKFRNIRLNYYAVKSLIARASLHFNDKNTALKYANEVIDETQIKNQYFPFATAAQISAAKSEDRVYSSEILFSLYNMKRSKDIFERVFSNNLNSMASLNQSTVGLDYFYDNLGSSDYRFKFQWEERTNADLVPVKVYLKYELPAEAIDTTVNKLEFKYYVPLIRISELYLIKAECLMGIDDQAAYDAINKIRTVRNVIDVAPSETKTLFEYIQWECAREFIGEGQLFWFYKRNNVTSIPNIGVGPKDGVYLKVPTDTGQFMFELPQLEIDKRK